jgi:hypothetical protein
LFAVVGGAAPKPPSCRELGLRRRPLALGEAAEARRANDHGAALAAAQVSPQTHLRHR